MAVTLTLIRQFAKMGKSPAEILCNVNDMLSEQNPNDMFVTTFIGIFDAETGSFTYANAGHNPPYLLGKTSGYVTGARKLPLGAFPNISYIETEMQLQAGDTLFMYTDGVTEAFNIEDCEFGTERLKDVLHRSKGKVYVETVLEAVRTFAGEAEQHDDITMLSLSVSESKAVLQGD